MRSARLPAAATTASHGRDWPLRSASGTTSGIDVEDAAPQRVQAQPRSGFPNCLTGPFTVA
jgi:hypothetical protein